MKNKLKLIYQKLYSCFGPQHWWPANSPFEVMLGAILTQNTNWQNVKKAIVNLKKHNLLNPHKLCRLPLKRLAFLIKPSGYYNIKAKRTKGFLKFLLKFYNANIKRMSLQTGPELRNQLLSVKGIGPETADSILLYALGKPIFVVDAYTKRILLRHGIVGQNADYSEIQKLFMNNLPRKVKLFNEYHALLVRLGKEFCLKNKPKCGLCPLKDSKRIRV